MRTLKSLILDELAGRYDAEKRLVYALPKMILAADCAHLQKLLRSHLKETVNQVKTLAKVFRSLGEKPRSRPCEATISLLKEVEAAALDNQGSPALNAALIAAIQKVEHHEIAAYGCLRDWAKALGNQDAAGLLQDILAEEKGANHALSEVARHRSNIAAHGEAGPAEPEGAVRGPVSSSGRPASRKPNLNRLRPVRM